MIKVGRVAYDIPVEVPIKHVTPTRKMIGNSQPASSATSSEHNATIAVVREMTRV
jgi:hypothetical protein